MVDKTVTAAVDNALTRAVSGKYVEVIPAQPRLFELSGYRANRGESQKIRVAAYCRVSTERRNSLEA